MNDVTNWRAALSGFSHSVPWYGSKWIDCTWYKSPRPQFDHRLSAAALPSLGYENKNNQITEDMAKLVRLNDWLILTTAEMEKINKVGKWYDGPEIYRWCFFGDTAAPITQQPKPIMQADKTWVLGVQQPYFVKRPFWWQTCDLA